MSGAVAKPLASATYIQASSQFCTRTKVSNKIMPAVMLNSSHRYNHTTSSYACINDMKHSFVCLLQMYLWKAKVGGRSYRSCARTSADLAFSCCIAIFCMYCLVEDLCKEYTDPLEICSRPWSHTFVKQRTEKRTENCALRHQFNEKPSVTPGCPGSYHHVHRVLH